MSEPLDGAYFEWLYSAVADPGIEDSSLSYWNILRKLFTTEFVWYIPNDDNRAQDGKALRQRFLSETGIYDVDPHWIDLGCSMLELMVGLSERLAYNADGEPHYWFWVLMENLDLRQYTDKTRLPEEKIEDILFKLEFRQYGADGRGGFFPLKYPERDQREQEIWSQMSDYIAELTH